MKRIAVAAAAALALALVGGPLLAQEHKKVPKDSVRVSIPGCVDRYIFTVGPRSEEHPGTVSIPVGTHLRMNGPKKLIKEIQSQAGMVEITGLMKKEQASPNGLRIGGVQIMPGQAPVAGGSLGAAGDPAGGQGYIDVEGWRAVAGDCPIG